MWSHPWGSSNSSHLWGEYGVLNSDPDRVNARLKRGRRILVEAQGPN